jgi:acyl-homoserine-lactone acylase
MSHQAQEQYTPEMLKHALTPLLFLSLSLPSYAIEDPSPQGMSESVRVLRDPWGVPHVLADSDYGAGYGYGWAVSEDRLKEALSGYWTVQGRRTEIEGKDALGIDRTFRLLRLAKHAEEAFPGYPALVRDVATGFADGVNDYMAAHPEETPEWAEPIHPAWPLALGRMIDYWLPLRAANGQARKIAPKIATPSTGTGPDHYEIMGSNGWALAPSRTEGGHAMIACDPHLPWKHEFLLHEVHLRGKSFEVAGAAFVGVPLPVFGRTRHTAWTWTANNPDNADVYRLKLVDGDPSRYHFGNKKLEFERREVNYKLPNGEDHTETLQWSVHGPITHVNEEEGYAVAYWFSAYGVTQAPVQYAEMLRAKSLDQLNKAMSQLQLAHFNLIAADTKGDIEFVYAGRVPKRDESVNANEPLDGSDKDLLWDKFIPFKKLPTVKNPTVGFVQNCNNRPENTTGTSQDPKADSAPPGVVNGGRPDTARAWYLRQQLASKKKFTTEDAIAVLTDGTMIPHGPLSRQLEAAWEKHGDAYPDREKIAADVLYILDWDGSPDLKSGAPTLFTLWTYELNNRKVTLEVALLERDPESLTEEDAFALFDAMKNARKRQRKLLPFPTRIPWALVHIIRKAGRVFPVETGMYPAISLMNANIDLTKPDLKSLTCRIGSSYVALHELSDPPVSFSVTPLGQTDRADLPYVYASTELFAKRQLKPLPFTDEQLAEVETTETVLTFTRKKTD